MKIYLSFFTIILFIACNRESVISDVYIKTEVTDFNAQIEDLKFAELKFNKREDSDNFKKWFDNEFLKFNSAGPEVFSRRPELLNVPDSLDNVPVTSADDPAIEKSREKVREYFKKLPMNLVYMDEKYSQTVSQFYNNLNVELEKNNGKLIKFYGRWAEMEKAIRENESRLK